MKYLLDTQAFLWFESGDERLSQKAKEIIENLAHEKLVSIASFWEISIKISLGKLQIAKSFKELSVLSGYSHLPISVSHIDYLSSLPFHHGDPFDRIIISQSVVEKIPLLSADRVFEKYPVDLVW